VANYYDYSISDVTDPEAVGLGFGVAPDGSARICISCSGKPINPELLQVDPTHQLDWVALTAECGKHLYEMLQDHFGDRRLKLDIGAAHALARERFPKDEQVYVDTVTELVCVLIAGRDAQAESIGWYEDALREWQAENKVLKQRVQELEVALAATLAAGNGLEAAVTALEQANRRPLDGGWTEDDDD
jgi:hypothetical protein